MVVYSTKDLDHGSITKDTRSGHTLVTYSNKDPDQGTHGHTRMTVYSAKMDNFGDTKGVILYPTTIDHSPQSAVTNSSNETLVINGT